MKLNPRTLRSYAGMGWKYIDGHVDGMAAVIGQAAEWFRHLLPKRWVAGKDRSDPEDGKS